MTFRTIALSAFAAVALSAGSAFVPFDGASIFVTEAAASETIASGSWTKKSFKVSGTWSIYTENGTTYVALSDDFKTRKAPDNPQVDTSFNSTGNTPHAQRSTHRF